MSEEQSDAGADVPEVASAPADVDDSPIDATRRGRRLRRAATPIATQVGPTRLSGAWTAVVIVVVLGVALIDFVVENTRSVQIDFFSASGHIPVAVALLAAALAGAAVVLAVGISRTAQLRLVIRRHRRRGANEALVPPPPE